VGIERYKKQRRGEMKDVARGIPGGGSGREKRKGEKRDGSEGLVSFAFRFQNAKSVFSLRTPH
jgi:hypothetical protein